MPTSMLCRESEMTAVMNSAEKSNAASSADPFTQLGEQPYDSICNN